ncbi:MAG: TlpA disulfide reductase family protein [Chitinophagaceae bacterium]
MIRKLFIASFCIGLLAAAALLPGTAHAQKTIRVTDESIVKDSAGTVYPASIWKELLNSGRYVLRVQDANADKPEFRLVRLTEEEYKRRMDNIPKPRESDYFTTGKPVGSFTATDIKGNKYKLKDLKGKVVVMNFWFVGCEPCRREIPELNKVVQDYKDSTDVVFLAVCLDDESPVEKFLEKMPFAYNIIAGGRFITSQYGINSYPTHLILDKEGLVAFHATGYSLGLAGWLRRSIADALK